MTNALPPHNQLLNNISAPSSAESRRNSGLLRVVALILLAAGIIVAIIALKLQLNRYTRSLVSPIIQFPTASMSAQLAQPTPQRTSPAVVYGFLPYWNMRSATVRPELTHVGYFSISIDASGNVITQNEDGPDQGWRTFNSESFGNLHETTSRQKQKLEVLITMMNADDIAAFLLNRTARTTFQKNLRMFVLSQPVDGINLDIEYAGEVTPNLRKAYTEFVADTAQTLMSIDPDMHLSLDVFADAGTKEMIWDIAALAPHVDHIVIMAYDFFRSSSQQSGPVAPLFGSEKDRWETDIIKNVKGFVEKMPAEKVLLGVPFYGYEWQTTSALPGANTYPKSGGVATYKRVQELIRDMGLREQWDADAFSPFLTYKESGNTQTIYYENSRSLSYKLDLVNQAGLGGIAIWALGYEGDSDELWHVIERKLILP